MVKTNYEKRFLEEVIYPFCDIPMDLKWTEETHMVTSYASRVLDTLNKLGSGCKNAEEIINRKNEEKEKKIEEIKEKKHIPKRRYHPRNPLADYSESKKPSVTVPEIKEREIYRSLAILENSGLIRKGESGDYQLTDNGSEYYKNLSELDLIVQVAVGVPFPPFEMPEEMRKIIEEPWPIRRGPFRDPWSRGRGPIYQAGRFN